MSTLPPRRRRSDTKPLSLLGNPHLLLSLLSLSLAAVLLLFSTSSSLLTSPPRSEISTIPPLQNPPAFPNGTKKSEKTVKLERGGPYHDWGLFELGFEEMMRTLKIFVYPDALNKSSLFSSVFLPHPNPSNPKLGNYYSEHIFKLALLHSPLLTSDHRKAGFFFMPFSVNALRNDPRVRSEAAIAEFVAGYAERVSREFGFWNASGGSDHFFVSCHSVGRDAAAKIRALRDNAIHVSCSSSYFQRNFVAHKDVSLPQIWPRRPELSPNPPGARKRLVFFAGRTQNSQIRKDLISMWENDSSIDIFSEKPPFPYEEGFMRSKFCLHVKGYEVNTARISDSIHHGCIPVILSNYYELPFASVLDWSKFSVILNHRDIAELKRVLLSFPPRLYLAMYNNLLQVRRHFVCHVPPTGYDSFYMTIHQLWLRRSTHLGHG